MIAPLDPDGGTNNAHYVVDGVVYGTPYMYGPNFLMYNTDVVTPAPTSWDVTFERPNSPYAGSITAYDDPVFIADAAMYLKRRTRISGSRTRTSSRRSSSTPRSICSSSSAELTGGSWSLWTDEVDGFVDGSMVVRDGVAGELLL